jgi:hypothetical protein
LVLATIGVVALVALAVTSGDRDADAVVGSVAGPELTRYQFVEQNLELPTGCAAPRVSGCRGTVDTHPPAIVASLAMTGHSRSD